MERKAKGCMLQQACGTDQGVGPCAAAVAPAPACATLSAGHAEPAMRPTGVSSKPCMPAWSECMGAREGGTVPWPTAARPAGVAQRRCPRPLRALGRLVRSPSPSVQFLLVWSHGRAVFPPPGPHLPAVSGCGTVPCCSKPPGLHRLPSGAPPASSGCKACRSAPTTVRACPAAAAAASQVGRAVQPVICGGGGRAISTHSVGSAVCRSPGASCAPPGPPRAADNSSGRVSAPPTRARARPGRRQRRQGFGAAPPARRSR